MPRWRNSPISVREGPRRRREAATTSEHPVSAAASAFLDDWDQVRKSLAALGSSHEELDQFFSSALDQLEALWGELLQRQRAFMEQCRRVEAEGQRRGSQPDPQPAVAPEAAEPLPSAWRETAEQWERERAELEQERKVLEAELDAVRTRAAELAEIVASQQRQMAEDRAHWAEELKYLRRLVERLLRQQLEQEAVPAPSFPKGDRRAEDIRAAETDTVAGNDPVLDSVAAQFAMLQKDVAHRRQVYPHAKP